MDSVERVVPGPVLTVHGVPGADLNTPEIVNPSSSGITGPQVGREHGVRGEKVITDLSI